MNKTMNDEKLGREWAKRNGGATPHRFGKDRWMWYDPESNGYLSFPWFLSMMLDRDDEPYYSSEQAAYAALGRALLDLVEFTDTVREAGI